EQGDQVRRPDDIDRGAVEIRRKRDARKRSVTAVGASEDSDALGVCRALSDEVLDAVSDVVLHFAAPFAVSGLEELLADAGGATEVGHEPGIAAVGEELCE